MSALQDVTSKSEPQKLSFAPNRDLLDPSFTGYKISLEPVPVYSLELQVSDLQPKPLSNDQISFAHTKLAIDHNSNVIAVNAASGKPYLLGQNSIHLILDRSQEQRNPETFSVWSSPSSDHGSLSSNQYNPSLSFANGSLAVYGNGLGSLQFFTLSSPTSWTSVFQEEICGSNRPFIVLDARRASSTGGDDEGPLHTLLYYVESSEQVSDTLPKEKYVSVVEWMTFEHKEEGLWTLDRVRRYAFLGPLEKAVLSEDGKTFAFVTDKPFKTVFDSTLGEEPSSCVVEEEKLIIPTNEEITPAPFHWHQTVEDMTLWCLLPMDTTKRDISVEFKPSFLNISAKGESLLYGKLWNLLESDTMSWTIKDRKLEVNFSKVNEGMIWQRFLAGGLLDGDELADPNAIDLIQDVLASREESAKDAQPPTSSFNMNELEDVDSAPDSSHFLLVVDGDSHRALLRGDLGGRQWLFKGPGSTFCIRHDVDGLIWDLRGGSSTELEHVSTFSALGYVQASKMSRKYTVFSPNYSFVAILDSCRHVYLYRQPTDIDSDLRNRKSGTRVKAIAKQSVITLEGNDEIIGAYASDTSIVLCTHKRLICIRVK